MHAAWWWIDRWRKSTAFTDMTAEEQGLYRNLLDEVWLRADHVIPDDPRILGKVSGDHEAWARSGPRVLGWMRRVETGWTHETAVEVIEQSQRFRQTQRVKGRKRAAAAVRGPGGSFQPAEHPAGSPAADQPGHQPRNQPPSPSPSPSPSPITVSVKKKPHGVSTAGAAEPSGGDDVSFEQPTAEQPAVKGKRNGHPTWLTPYLDAWHQTMRGIAPAGPLARYARLVEADLGAEKAVASLRGYLTAVIDKPEYATPAQWAKAAGQWLKKVEPDPDGEVWYGPHKFKRGQI